jgi:hypothetical protein
LHNYGILKIINLNITLSTKYFILFYSNDVLKIFQEFFQKNNEKNKSKGATVPPINMVGPSN